MLKLGLPFLVSAALAGGAAMTIAWAVGTPTLRLRGAYFAFGTLALAESAKQLALAWDRLTGIPFTGGSAGVSLPLSAGYLVFYYVMLGLMTAVTAAAFWLRGSKFGYGLRAVGENDRLAEASGVDIHRLKRRVYVGSALAIAVTGGTAGYWLSYINAAEVFSASMTFQMVVMALLGGIGTPLGPVLGAAFLTLASEFLGTRFVYHYLIAIGIIIVGISLFAPAGLSGLLDLAWWLRLDRALDVWRALRLLIVTCNESPATSARTGAPRLRKPASASTPSMASVIGMSAPITPSR